MKLLRGSAWSDRDVKGIRVLKVAYIVALILAACHFIFGISIGLFQYHGTGDWTELVLTFAFAALLWYWPLLICVVMLNIVGARIENREKKQKSMVALLACMLAVTPLYPFALFLAAFAGIFTRY